MLSTLFPQINWTYNVLKYGFVTSLRNNVGIAKHPMYICAHLLKEKMELRQFK